jgi:hypothetical protein
MGSGSTSADLFSRRLRLSKKKTEEKFILFFFLKFEEQNSYFFRHDWYVEAA